VEITPIKEVDGRILGDGTPGPITRRLQKTFFDAVHGRLEQYRSWLAFASTEGVLESVP
jgi:branched-chain amino acid aminotransferase